jgi:hypothetical protein
MESSIKEDEKKEESPQTSTTKDSSRGCAETNDVIVDGSGILCVQQLQVDQHDNAIDANDLALHEEESKQSFRTSAATNGAATDANAIDIETKPNEASDELATACYQFIEGSVPGSYETESSRSSPSNDGFSLGDGTPLIGGRPRSSSLDSKRSTKSKSGNGLRRGKWTSEEENYVARVIQDFNSGFLDAPAGTTLRTYLSEKLQCDPMRITKKFTGDSCIGKRVFHPAVRSSSNASAIDRAQVCVSLSYAYLIVGMSSLALTCQ